MFLCSHDHKRLGVHGGHQRRVEAFWAEGSILRISLADHDLYMILIECFDEGWSNHRQEPHGGADEEAQGTLGEHGIYGTRMLSFCMQTSSTSAPVTPEKGEIQKKPMPPTPVTADVEKYKKATWSSGLTWFQPWQAKTSSGSKDVAKKVPQDKGWWLGLFLSSCQEWKIIKHVSH